MDFGFAFQLVDDLLDLEEDTREGRIINYAIHHGVPATVKQVENLLYRCKSGLQALGLSSKPLLGMVELMQSKVEVAVV